MQQDRNKDKMNLDTNHFKDFKAFIRPSTSAVELRTAPKLRIDQKSTYLGPRFVTSQEKETLNDVKTYKDIPVEKHLGPLEINYKYKLESFYDKKPEKVPTTASQTVRPRPNPSRQEMAKTSYGQKRAAPTPKSPKFYRSSSAGEIIETIPSKRLGVQAQKFPNDFCIENTLVSLTFRQDV